MAEIDDGGPAFPVPFILNGNGDVVYSEETGLSLRAYLAGQALIGVRSHKPYRWIDRIKAFFGVRFNSVSSDPATLAKHSVSVADALLAELRK